MSGDGGHRRIRTTMAAAVESPRDVLSAEVIGVLVFVAVVPLAVRIVSKRLLARNRG
jgi:hypothetical protein